MSSGVSVKTPKKKRKNTTEKQIRGSSLLMAGKFLSRGVNIIVQTLIIRYLPQEDFGTFAIVLSYVTIIQTFATFGLDRAITRFIPIYQEREEYNKLFGTIAMVFGAILTLGLSFALLANFFSGIIGESLIPDPLSLNLLLILVFLAPIQAVDQLIVGLFAVFASPKSIFFRKNVLGPALKLTVVLILILSKGDIFVLAIGQVVSATLGIGIYFTMLHRLFKEQELYGRLKIKAMTFPWREVLAFTVPLLSSDLMFMLMNQMDTVMLGYYQGSVAAALVKAVQPYAKMNLMVLSSFGLLFTPLAARKFARKEREGINEMYWQNAVWIAVASFPIFALTFSFAKPLVAILGKEYEESAIIMALLSLAYFFNAALGQNGLTLKVFGKLRYVVILNVIASVANITANFILIPRYGALGAASATAGTIILHNILKQLGLRLGTGINIFDPTYTRVYASIVGSTILLTLIQWLAEPSIYISVVLAGTLSLFIVRFNRHLLQIEKTFPELLKVPLVGKFLE